MTRTATQGLMMTGAFVGILLVATLSVVEFDGDGGAGIAIGSGLGVLNLVLGYLVTIRALQKGMKSATATLLGGFILRLLVVAGLVVIFQQGDSVDPAAFALSFMVFFFVYLFAEVLLVERSANQRREAV